MKKIFAAAAITLCFASNSFAQESAGGQSASDSAFGEIGNEEIVASLVGVGILAAMVANNRGDAKFNEPDGEDPGEDPICGAGEELIDGVCTPVVTPPPLTTSVSTSVTTSVTSTTTTPVTVSATTTSL
jgi:hypothetical protein